MALMNEIEKPARAVGLHFSVWGVVGWVIGAVAVLLLFMVVVLPTVAKAKSAVSGGKSMTETTLAEQSNNLGVGWL